MFEKDCVKCTKVLVATPFYVGEFVNLQFYNRHCSYSLSIVDLLEENFQTFALARVTFGTTAFSKEWLLQGTYSLYFLLWNCSFWEQLLLKRIYLKQQIFVKTIYIFQNTTWSRPFFKVVCHFFQERSSDRPFFFFDRIDFFWRINLIHPIFHGGWFFTRAVAAMHSFRGYMEQIIFDSNCLLRTDTFFGRPILGTRFFNWNERFSQRDLFQNT